MLIVFGGSFDPVHLGHEAMADAARRAHPRARLLWVPARRAPHKPELEPAPAAERLALLRRVVAARAGEAILTAELERSGPSFTVDTLEALHRAEPDEDLALLIGADSLASLALWRAPERILALARLLVAPRAGLGAAELERVARGLPPPLVGALRAEGLAMEEAPYSSTAIRAALRRGEQPAGLRPEVAAEIRARGLYGARAPGGATS